MAGLHSNSAIQAGRRVIFQVQQFLDHGEDSLGLGNIVFDNSTNRGTLGRFQLTAQKLNLFCETFPFPDPFVDFSLFVFGRRPLNVPRLLKGRPLK